MTSLSDMVGQYMQKKEEDKRIAEDQATKDRYWKIPICYDDDDDEESSIPLKDIIISRLPPSVAITPVLLTEEPVDSLIMEDEHLDTIPQTGIQDEVINVLVLSPCLIPNQFEGFSDSNDDSTSIDDDSFCTSALEEVKDIHIGDGEIEVDSLLFPQISNSSWRRLTPLIILHLNLKLFALTWKRIVVAVPLPVLIILFRIMKLSFRWTIILREKLVASMYHSHADFSQYDSFIFDLSNDSFPPADRNSGELTSIVDSGIRENVLSTTNVNLPFEDDQSLSGLCCLGSFLSFVFTLSRYSTIYSLLRERRYHF
ncbi:hypothetical protein Tco_0791726 [Tanacetum coccineum]